MQLPLKSLKRIAQRLRLCGLIFQLLRKVDRQLLTAQATLKRNPR
jgi:hypothetical protein